MFVRVIEPLRREGLTVFPGALLDVDEQTAAAMIQDGIAVPVPAGDFEIAERR